MTAMGMYNFSSSDGTTRNFTLGTIVENKGASWIYILAKGALVAYEYALEIATDTGEFGVGSYNSTYPALNVVTNVAIPQFVFADAEYGWALCGPFPPIRNDGVASTYKVSTLTLAVLNTILYTSATAGSVDDSSSSQVQIQGLTVLSTVGGSTAATACKATRKLAVNS